MENTIKTNITNTNPSNDIIFHAFHTFLKNTTDMIFVKDVNLVYQSSSLPFIKMTGHDSEEEIIGKSDFDIFKNPELAKRYTDDDRKLLDSCKDLINYIEPLTDDDGHPRYSSTSKYILRDPSGTVIGILGVSRDITREYIAQRRHQQELKYLFELPEDTYAALFMDIDDWRIIRHHRRTVGDIIIPICETMENFALDAINSLTDPEEKIIRSFFETLSRESLLEICNSGIRNYSLEYLRHMPNGQNIWVHTDINFLIDPENGHQCAIWTLRDIHSQKQDSLNLLKAAEYDEMTGILNRASTRKYIQETLENSQQELHALFVIDIDNFKSLNDTLGHQQGDYFLTSLAKLLKSCFRSNDIVGRIGGDEFFVLMKNVPSTNIVSEKASTLMGISKVLCSSYPDLNLSISIGISLYPANGNTLDSLYASADKALYQAKNHGKNQYVISQDILTDRK